MALLDDLKGILSPDEFAKVAANAAVATRIAKGDELYGYYVGEDTPPAPAAAATPPASVTPPAAAGQFDLGAIERMFDTRLGKINETIDAKVADIVKQRGDELYNNVRSGVRSDALQLVKIYTRHQEATGKTWDDAEEVKFNDYLKANNESLKAGTGGKPFKNLTEAYNDYIAPTVTERTIESEVTKRVKATSGQHVPGTTPAPVANRNIRHLQLLNRPTDGAGQTSAQRAAAALDARIASREAQAS